MHKHAQLDSKEEGELSQLNGVVIRNIQLLNDKMLMEVYINGHRVWMEIDTEAVVSVNDFSENSMDTCATSSNSYDQLQDRDWNW